MSVNIHYHILLSLLMTILLMMTSRIFHREEHFLSFNTICDATQVRSRMDSVRSPQMSMLDRPKIDGTWGEIHGNPLENGGFHGNNAVKKMVYVYHP